jgi:predicted secreted protein
MGAISVAGLIALFLSIPAFADPAPTLLRLNQVAERSVARDRLTIELRTEASGADPRLVQAEVNRRMNAALGKARSVAAVTAMTGTYDTFGTTPSGPDSQPKPVQWHAAQTLSLTARDFAAALALAGRLQADGLLVSAMRFDVAPETLRSQERALTDEALNALTARAGQIAATLGLRVAGIETLTVGNAAQPGGGPRPFMMARATGNAAPAPAAAAGDTVISVSVDAAIALVPGR